MTPITFRTRVNVGTLTIFACFVVFWLSQLFGAWTLMSVFPLTMAVMFSYLGWALSGEVSLSVTDADLHIVGSRPGQQRLTVPITQITTIRNAPRPIWTFALRRSPKIQKFPQLEIRYKTVSNVVVAPTDPEAFVAALLARNPAIALEAGKRVPGVAGLRNRCRMEGAASHAAGGRGACALDPASVPTPLRFSLLAAGHPVCAI